MSVIKADVFKRRDPLKEEVRRALGCRGTGVQARDSQANLKYVKMNRALRREERQGLREDVRRAGREGRGDL